MHKATCSDCGAECEVPFKPEKGKPVRCQDCFRKNKPQRSNRGFGGNRGFSGNRGFGGNRRFERRPREMHKAICAECKKECEVPFKPTEDRDVFCQECFMKRKDSEFGGESAKDTEKTESESKENLEDF